MTKKGLWKIALVGVLLFVGLSLIPLGSAADVNGGIPRGVLREEAASQALGIVATPTPDPNWPDNCSLQCSAKDVKIDQNGVWLTVQGGGSDCNPPAGYAQVTIWVKVCNGKGSDATNVWLFADLYEGGTYRGRITSCVAEKIAGKSCAEKAVYTYAWDHQESLSLRNIYVTWGTPGNPGEGCWQVCNPSGQSWCGGTIEVAAPFWVDFSFSKACVGGATERVSFDGIATGGTKPYSWSWDFGDGGTSTQENPTHTYAAAGTYQVTLTARDSKGKTCTVKKNVTVESCGTDLSISKVDSPDPVSAGGVLTYTLVVVNNGPNVAVNVVVTDALPGLLSGAQYQVNGGGWQPYGGSVSLGTVDVGTGNKKTITIRATVGCPANCEQVIVNTATVGSSTPDTNPNNNSATVQTTVKDTTPPVITCPANKTVYLDNKCEADTRPEVTGRATATDNCGVGIPYYEDVTQTLSCGYVILRTWIVTDTCGLEARCTQRITVTDNIKPAVTKGTIASCYASVAEAEAAAKAATTYSDNCTPAASLVVTATTTGDCSAVVTVRVTDECGNYDEVQYTTRIDAEPPTFSYCPSYLCVCASQGLTATIPAAQVIAKDNCNGDVTIVQSPAPGTIVGPGMHTIYITATDECGNEAYCQVTFEVKTGTIVVHKFHDRNANGVDDGQVDEPLAGWSFALYANGANGQPIRTGTTGDDGTITWSGLGCGTYTVVETLQSGWANSTPLSQQVTVGNPCGNGQAVEVRFGNYKLGKISGYKYEDVNGNGVWDAGEPALGGWTIRLLSGGNEVASTTTRSPDGYYEFSGLKPGTYGLGEVIQSGWTQTRAPAPVVLDPEEESTDNDFGNFKYVVVRGHKWLDIDGDGVWDAGEPGIPGWKITLAGPNGAQAIVAGPLAASPASVQETTTDASGAYTFTISLPGAYTVSEETRDSHVPTTPTSRSFTAESGKEVVVNFGNQSKLGGGGVMGFKFSDVDADGTWDAGEPALPGWTIRLRRVVGGAVVYQTTTLDAPGAPAHGAWFVTVPITPGDYIVEEVLQTGWVQTYPAGGSYSIRVNGDGSYAVLAPAGHVGKLNFGNTQWNPGLMGFKFEDRDGDGAYDYGEPRLSGWTIRMINVGSGEVAYVTQTGSNGNWSLSQMLPAGTYRVEEVLQAGWVQTHPGGNGYYIIQLYANGQYDVLSGNAVWGLSFGNRRSAALPCPSCPEWLVFQSDRDGNWEIYRSTLTGDEVLRLTTSPAADIQPTWHFGGREIAFASRRDGNWEIYRMNADGSGQTNVTKRPAFDDLAPSWSCSWIAFQTNRDGNWEIYKTDPDGRVQIRLTNNSAADQAPNWSPDGEWIAFESNRDGDWEIYVMDGDGNNLRRITTNPAADRNPSWSPDGKWIVFESNREGGQFNLYKVNVETGDLVRLTNNPADDTAAAWMPYCEWIFFQTVRDGNVEVYRMNPDGSDQRNVTKAPEFMDPLDWIPVNLRLPGRIRLIR